MSSVAVVLGESSSLRWWFRVGGTGGRERAEPVSGWLRLPEGLRGERKCRG